MKFQWLLSPHSAEGFLRSKEISRIERPPLIHLTEHLFFKIPARYGLVNITSVVQDILKRADIEDGQCFVSTMHITAGIFVNDAESGLLEDISQWLERLAPWADYKHHQTGEDNGDSHLKSYLTQHEVTIPVTRGRLDFGTWQQVFYAGFDGLREKRVLVKVMGVSK